MTTPTDCVHGNLRRACETCDLRESRDWWMTARSEAISLDLAAALAEVERLRTGVEEAIGWTDSGGECGQRLYNLLHPEVKP